MFILKSRRYGRYCEIWDGYYTGKKYIFQGELYAVCDRRLDEVKKYSSRRKAERACEILNDKVCNYYFDVIGVKNE